MITPFQIEAKQIYVCQTKQREVISSRSKRNSGGSSSQRGILITDGNQEGQKEMQEQLWVNYESKEHINEH